MSPIGLESRRTAGRPPRCTAGGGAIDSNDVTAVILTLGEDTTERALASVERQTLAPVEIIVVEGVEPMHSAMNEAASRARSTPFFVQVDADMILDSTCFAALRAAVRPEVGIFTGALRDPLVGPINGVKLFRRECFETVQCTDTVSWDSDFYTALVARGWLTVNVLAAPERFVEVGHTFGEHRPPYTPSYTYATYYLLGRKYSVRSNPPALVKWRLRKLRASADPIASVARVALAHGFFAQVTRDVGKQAVVPDDDVLTGMLNGNGASPPLPAELPLDGEPGQVCRGFYELGRVLRSESAYSTLRSWMRDLGHTSIDASWLAEFSLHQGFLAFPDGDGRNGRVYERLLNTGLR